MQAPKLLTPWQSQGIDMCMTLHRSWTEEALRTELDRYEVELRAAGKARNTVTTYVQHPERFINWLVGRYETKPMTAHAGPNDRSASRSKYEPLRTYLDGRSETTVRATFAQIEEILGVALPPSARKYRPWWANEQAGTHVHARAWLDAGRRTSNVDLKAGTVEFLR